MPPVEDLVSDMLKYCLDSSDKDRAFVEFRPDDVVLLLINNFGGKQHESLGRFVGLAEKAVPLTYLLGESSLALLTPIALQA